MLRRTDEDADWFLAWRSLWRQAPQPARTDPVLGTLAMAFLLLRAFSSGCAALTGVEAISNGVPAFRRPKIKNAQKTLMAMGATAILLFSGLVAIALILPRLRRGGAST